jgi:hypothetical protein
MPMMGKKKSGYDAKGMGMAMAKKAAGKAGKSMMMTKAKKKKK